MQTTRRLPRGSAMLGVKQLRERIRNGEAELSTEANKVMLRRENRRRVQDVSNYARHSFNDTQVSIYSAKDRIPGTKNRRANTRSAVPPMRDFILGVATRVKSVHHQASACEARSMD